MSRRRKRTRSRGGGTDRGFLPKASVLLIVVGAIVGFTFQTGAFTTLDADRSTDVRAATDQNALIGVDIADSITVGGGGGGGGGISCDFGTNDLVVDRYQSDDIDTDQDVVVEGNSVDIDVETDGCVRIESGARLNGDIEAGGDVIVESGGRLSGDVDADGGVTVQSGARIDGDVDAGGDVTVESGARIDGDVEAGGSVTVGPGGRITGDVEEGSGDDSGSGQQFLLGVTNNLNSEATVTVTLQDPNDGTLFAGSDSGDSVQFTLAPGAHQDVSIEPSDTPGSSIGFQITAESVGGESSVTLQRAVGTTEVSDGGGSGDGDDGSDDDDDGDDEDDDDDEDEDD